VNRTAAIVVHIAATVPNVYALFAQRRNKMSKGKDSQDRKTLSKRTSQGGSKPKTSSMSKGEKRSFKSYRGQGK
jgi:hypothetical protein